MGKFFKNSYFISIFLTVILSLMVWFLPKIIEIEFLFETSKRWEVIALLTGICLISLGVHFWLNKKRNDDAYEAYGNASTAEDSESATAREQAQDIQKKLNQTLALLKRNKYSLQDTPHYIIIGPPGSGKTTILENSKLEEPTALRGQGVRRETTGLGGTRNCDWWITNDAILIDTAGRYFSDESGSNIDKKVWKNFLKMLCKTRRNVPINGVLIIFDINDLLTQSHQQRQEHVRKIQKHLYELNETLGIRYPIYVLFSKLDLIAGFNQYFNGFEKRQELLDQVFGFTFPLEKTQASGFTKFKSYFSESINNVSSNTENFSKEFEDLIKRLNEGVIASISNTNNIANRELIYRFPQELSLAKQTLEEFISKVFEPSRNYEPVLRGVYFTSGTQTGSPIERVMAGYINNLQLNISSLSETYQGEGRSYFINKLLTDVIFEEQNLVSFGRGHFSTLRYNVLFASLVVSVIAVLTYGIALWPASASENKAKLKKIEELVVSYKKHNPEKETRRVNWKKLLPALNDAYEASKVFNIKNDSNSMHKGLYQGEEFAEQKFYSHVLDRVFLRHIALYLLEIMKNRMENPAQDKTKLYADVSRVLKAYLMIQEKFSNEYFNKKEFEGILLDYWSKESNSRINKDTYDGLKLHLDRLQPVEFIKADEINDTKFISELRSELTHKNGITDRLYAEIANDIKEYDIDDYQLNNKMKELFSPSEMGGSFPKISGLYTAQGYCGFFQNLGNNGFVEKIEQMNWLLDNDEKTRQYQDNIKDVYAEKYIQAWKKLLNDLRIKKMDDRKDISDRLYALSNPDSVLKILLADVKNNTDIGLKCALDENDRTDTKNKATDIAIEEATRKSSAVRKAKHISDKFSKNNKSKKKVTPKEVKVIRDAFKNLNNLNIAKLDDKLKQVKEAIDRNSDDTDRVIENLKQDINNLLGDSGNNDGISDLKRIFDSVKNAAKDGAKKGKKERVVKGLNEAWKNILFECSNVKGVYPPSQDIPINAFASFFSPNGILDNFEKNNFNPAKSEMPSLKVPNIFKNGKYLREAFFDGRRLGVRFTLEPIESSGILSSTFRYGNNKLFYEAGTPIKSATFNWPDIDGEKPTVTLKLESGDSPQFSGDSGNWGIFHFISKFKHGNYVTFSNRGGSIKYHLKVDNHNNAFNKRVNISCPEKLM